MNDFNLYTADLSGKKLIEASAGTGKTFTLSGLYIRYVVEKKLPPEKIVVLTFTKAATFELKTRLRQQLIECKNHLLSIKEISEAENADLYALYQSYKADDNTLKHINLALACFDQAAIFTINSFCQKIIVDHNKECGSPVFNELIDKTEHVKQFVYDFWRQQQSSEAIEFLLSLPNPNEVTDNINRLLNKSHYRDRKPLFRWSQLSGLYQDFKSLSKLWDSQQEMLLDYLLSGDFNGVSYKKSNREKYQTDLTVFFSALEGKECHRFKASFIEGKLKKGKLLKPMPEFFVQFEAFFDNVFYDNENKSSIGSHLVFSFMYECWLFVKEKLETLLSDKGMYSYDDQIKVVHKSVMNNARLREKIGQQWQTVLVDEFQDTDALQLGIFQRCFDDNQHDIVYVGDPKQAIYDFRGADVFVYESAKKGIKNQQQFNLATNWRSNKELLSATNCMFDFKESFALDWLQFTASKPKPIQQEQLLDRYPPIAIIDGKVEQRMQDLVFEIKRFIKQARIQSCTDKQNNKKLEDGKMAVLVQSNSKAIEMYEYLLGHNLNVSLWSESGIFYTEVAKNIYYLIRAIAYPSSKNIFTSFHGMLFNIALNDLHQLDKQQLISEFVDCRLNSHKKGLTAVIQSLFENKQVYENVLKRQEGERLYTDIVQILELIQIQQDLGKNENQIAEYLAKEIEQAKTIEQNETLKRRLESDGEKISIMTMHKSKGLQFDCVFIPFADSIKLKTSKGKSKNCIATHDENNQGVIYWHYSKSAQLKLKAEKIAENIRTLYVAITRAKYRVYLGLDTEHKKFHECSVYPLYQQIKDKQEYSQTVEIEEQTIDYSRESSLIVPLKKAEFSRSLQKPLSIYSFSSLTRLQEISFERSDEDSDELDFNNYFHFPKGAKSGTMQHEILENISFKDDLPTVKKEVMKQLEIYNFNWHWIDTLSKQMLRIINVALWKQGPSLAHVDNSIDEMEFMLPVGSITNNTISSWLSQHRGLVTVFNQEHLQGYLTGFIDLIFQANNKYYVVDYKSNYLGSDYSDYSSDKLKTAIEHHYYDLQYLIYTVALVKSLLAIDKNFDYHKDFGGIAYIFTRGVNGEDGQGVYTCKPQKKVIDGMLGEFCGQ